MSESDKKSIAALLYVTLRRSANRVIDVEWMGKNEEYAREVMQLARQQGSEELKHYAERYEELAFGSTAGKPLPATVATATSPVTPNRPPVAPIIHPDEENDDEDDGALPGHYIGTLR